LAVLSPCNVASHSANATPFAEWSCCAHAPGSVGNPDQLRAARSEWLPALVPGTIASALQALGRWSSGDPLDADAHDWWYRAHFDTPPMAPGDTCHLCFDGLATLAEVWLNGKLVLTADNMFRAYRIDITPHLKPSNELALVFRSLSQDLNQKRPRPRWKTNLVNHQQLRWRRTTLLSRMPGWSPPVAAVGPWRTVRLEVGPVLVSDRRLVSIVHDDIGTVTLRVRITSTAPLEQATFIVGAERVAAGVSADGKDWLVNAVLHMPNPPLWWPHTHGSQPLLPCSLELHTSDSDTHFDVGKVGFRSIEIIQDPSFSIHVNGMPIYCRGACWTVGDIATLDGTNETLIHDLRLAREAGINMLRVVGTMIYESDAFYQQCDELGILVWQDFMFANMDYPVNDVDFEANIKAEASYQLSRLAKHPCVAVYCGNSEVEQQASMLGMPRERWRNRWFGEQLPALCAAHHPGTSYVPSTPSGGVMPFHVRDGIAHYYGVGAYLRSPQELRRADVKFTPECLAFANIPEPATVDIIMNGNQAAAHHPLWKQRVPRDSGAGWDFEDVRDHYLRQFFGIDPIQLRSFDMRRYLQLSRVVTGEIMAQAFSEWRSTYSHNQGALVWFFKDLWPAAGWGIVDSLGFPKAPYYYLRRAWQTRQIIITDEGLDGLHLHIINESAGPFDGFVELLLISEPQTIIARQEMRCSVPARTRQTLQSDEILNGFYDVSYAYRFGPAKHDIVIATLFDERHEVVSEAVHFMHQRVPAYFSDVQVSAEATELADGWYQLTLQSDCFLQSVSVDANGFLPDDNYFHLTPSRQKSVLLRPRGTSSGSFKCYLEALNLREPLKTALKKATT
jgi:beta-mannosidase